MFDGKFTVDGRLQDKTTSINGNNGVIVDNVFKRKCKQDLYRSITDIVCPLVPGNFLLN